MPDPPMAGSDLPTDRVMPPGPSPLPGLPLPNRSSPVPLYHQLANAITDMVGAGTLRAGDQLPPERELAERTGVSRMTARQALADLERGGVITVRHGVGTFVATPRIVLDTIHLQGFTEMAEQSGLTATSRVVDQHVAPASAAGMAALGLGNGSNVVVITRVRSLGGEPIVLETSQLDAARFGALTAEELEGSLYRLLERRFAVRLSHATEVIEARRAGSVEAELLRITAGDPTLVVSGTAWQGETAVEWFESVYPAERVRLAVNSQRQAARSEAGAPTVSMVLA